ncbi:unnamed protein product [Arctogadus glacialis]
MATEMYHDQLHPVYKDSTSECWLAVREKHGFRVRTRTSQGRPLTSTVPADAIHQLVFRRPCVVTTEMSSVLQRSEVVLLTAMESGHHEGARVLCGLCRGNTYSAAISLFTHV